MATPTATPSEVSQDLTTGINVTLACSTDQAKIYYTDDGTDPTAEKTLYSDPISVQTAEPSKTIKAIAVKEGMADSEVLSITYTNSNATVQTAKANARTKKTETK